MENNKALTPSDGHELINRTFDNLKGKDGGEVRGILVFVLGDNGVQAGQEGGISLECIDIIRAVCHNAETELHRYLSKNN